MWGFYPFPSSELSIAHIGGGGVWAVISPHFRPQC